MDIVPFDDEVPDGYQGVVKSKLNQIDQDWNKQSLWNLNINCTISGLTAEPWIHHYHRLRVYHLQEAQEPIAEELVKDKIEKFNQGGAGPLNP